MQSNGKRKGAGLPGVFLRLIVPGTIAVLLFFFGAPSKPVSAASAPSAASVHSAAADSTDKEYFEIIKSIDLLGEVYREVSKSYVDTLNVRKLMYAGIDGMLRTLDPYTVFLDEDDSDELDELTSGHYAGIGITIASIEGADFCHIGG